VTARRRSKKAVFAEPNMIPLIDVSLILVIIFMVITPMMVRSELTVNLPKSKSSNTVPNSNAITVQISGSGALLVDGNAVSWQNLKHELILKLPHAAQKTILVEADKSVPIEKVVYVMDTAKRLGVGKLGVGVSQTAR
jgi:biopolymer transport protein ExbD